MADPVDELAPWEDVQEHFRRAYPELSVDQMESMYRQEQAHRRQHNRYAQGEPTTSYLTRRVLPGASTMIGVRAARDYAAARARIAAGEPREAQEGALNLGLGIGDTPSDYDVVAEYHRAHQHDSERGTGGQILSGLAHAPAIVGEAMAGQSLFRGVAPGLAIAEGAPGVLGRGAMASRGAFGMAAARTAAGAVTTPGMWAPEWIQNNEEAGRDPVDPRGLPAALTMGFMQTAVLGSLSTPFGIGKTTLTRPGILGAIQRLGARAGVGMLEQQGIDVMATAISRVAEPLKEMDTQWGLVGHLLRPGVANSLTGKDSNFWKHFFSQAVTFGAFAVMHGADPKEIADTVKEGMDAGKTPEESAQIAIQKAQEVAQSTHQEAQGPEPGIDRISPTETPTQAQEAQTPVQQPPVAQEVAKPAVPEAPVKPAKNEIPRADIEALAQHPAFSVPIKKGRTPRATEAIVKDLENLPGGKEALAALDQVHNPAPPAEPQAQNKPETPTTHAKRQVDIEGIGRRSLDASGTPLISGADRDILAERARRGIPYKETPVESPKAVTAEQRFPVGSRVEWTEGFPPSKRTGTVVSWKNDPVTGQRVPVMRVGQTDFPAVDVLHSGRVLESPEKPKETPVEAAPGAEAPKSPFTPKHITPENAPRIKEMLDRGMSYGQIAKELGIPKGSVHYYAKKQGWAQAKVENAQSEARNSGVPRASGDQAGTEGLAQERRSLPMEVQEHLNELVVDAMEQHKEGKLDLVDFEGRMNKIKGLDDQTKKKTLEAIRNYVDETTAPGVKELMTPEAHDTLQQRVTGEHGEDTQSASDLSALNDVKKAKEEEDAARRNAAAAGEPESAIAETLRRAAQIDAAAGQAHSAKEQIEASPASASSGAADTIPQGSEVIHAAGGNKVASQFASAQEHLNDSFGNSSMAELRSKLPKMTDKEFAEGILKLHNAEKLRVYSDQTVGSKYFKDAGGIIDPENPSVGYSGFLHNGTITVDDLINAFPVNPFSKTEPLPPEEYRESGGTHGMGPLIPSGTNKSKALAKESVKETRLAEGLSEIEKQASQGDEMLWNKARETIAADPALPTRIAQEVIETNGGRALNTTEKMALLHRSISVRNELDGVLKQSLGGEAMSMSDRAYKALQDRIQDLTAERDLIDRASDLAGSESGRSLRIQRLLAKYDYSLGTLIGRAETAKKEKLSDAERKEFADLAAKHKELQDKFDKIREEYDNRPKPEPGKPEPEGGLTKDDVDNVRIGINDVQGVINGKINNYDWANKPLADRVMWWIKKALVASFISSPKTAAKIGASSILQVAKQPVLDLIKDALKLIPGVKTTVADKAPIEGRGFDASRTAKEMGAAWGGLSNIWEVLTTGKSKLDKQYGATAWDGPNTWLDIFGRFHQAEKEPAVQAEYERARLNITEAEQKAGRDTTSYAAQEAINMRAYEQSKRAKFQQDSEVVDKFTKWIEGMKRSENTGVKIFGHGLDLLTPIRKTPFNIVCDALEHLVGLPLGLIKSAHAGRSETALKGHEADAIMRMMAKGTLGLPLFALGFYLSKNSLGGFYSGKRREDDLKPGEIQAGDLRVPAWVTVHHPVFMALQLGATVGRAREAHKRGEPGVATGFGEGLGALLEEVPMVRSQTELLHAFRDENSVGRLARSYAVPQLLQWLATNTDTDMAGKAIKRRPQGVLQGIQAGLPGMRQTLPVGH
jgi:AcrR family transcriptional regulator